MAALELFPEGEIVSCAISGEVFRQVVEAEVDGAVLPIENSLHGSVAEHYDLLLAQPVRIVGESLMRIKHNLIVAPGARALQLRRVLSHPVALAQCRSFLGRHPELDAVPFYDTAGSVKYLMSERQTDTAAIAPELAALVYRAEVLERGIEDHAENYTRFHVLGRDCEDGLPGLGGLAINGETETAANKLTLGFSIDHRPGTLVRALSLLARHGLNLTKIESRPVPGKPWKYVFFVDLRFSDAGIADMAIDELRGECVFVKEMGRYRAAVDRPGTRPSQQ